MKRLLFIFTFFILLVVNGRAQGVETLTLEDCLRIGIDNNLSLESKRREIQKSKYGVSENRARLLPQISAVAGYSNNFDPPVSVTDGSSYGVPYNITQTLQHSANAGLEMQMPLFNQTLYTSMSIAKVVEEISRLSYGKAREDIILQISKMYYLGQVTAEQIVLIKANITRLEELRDITRAFFDNGMSMEVDLKRVNINLENLKVQYDNAQAMMKQQLNMLKYIMDYPAEKELYIRERIKYIKKKSENSDDDFKVVVFDLYDIMIDILIRKGYLEKCYQFEKTKGFERVSKSISNMLRITSSDSLIVNHIRDNTPEKAVVFITGIGKCYPILRSHTVLNNLHQVIDNVPVVLFYPGNYDGQELVLFGEIKDDNYYRAFKLVD